RSGRLCQLAGRQVIVRFDQPLRSTTAMNSRAKAPQAMTRVEGAGRAAASLMALEYGEGRLRPAAPEATLSRPLATVSFCDCISQDRGCGQSLIAFEPQTLYLSLKIIYSYIRYKLAIA